MGKITKDTTVGEIVSKYSNGAEILSGFGLHCFGCPMSQMESVEDASAVHGVDIELMIRKLNEDLVEAKPENE